MIWRGYGGAVAVAGFVEVSGLLVLQGLQRDGSGVLRRTRAKGRRSIVAGGDIGAGLMRRRLEQLFATSAGFGTINLDQHAHQWVVNIVQFIAFKAAMLFQVSGLFDIVLVGQ